MRLSKWMVLPAVCGLFVLSGSAMAWADKTVKLEGVHLCCGACVKGVATALKGVEGVKPKCDQKAGTVTLTSASDESLRKALDALGAAGYYGASSEKDLGVKAPKTSAGKVSSIKLSGVHNCCGSCCRAIKSAVKGVAGVKGDTATPKNESFEVTGDFDPAELIKALNAAGFNATIN
ncbi:MAG: hypothetical protein U0835_21095 [Isosphaeraceae bacterium]